MKTYKIKTETNGEKVKYYLRAKSKYDAYRQAYERELQSCESMGVEYKGNFIEVTKATKEEMYVQDLKNIKKNISDGRTEREKDAIDGFCHLVISLMKKNYEFEKKVIDNRGRLC